MLNLSKNKKYLLACSFGPDSMALFKMLLMENIEFEVAHVNYHLREEAISETEGLKKYCDENKIKLHILNVVDINKNKNVEEQCRIKRYDFFASLNKNNNFFGVLVAHQQDDLIETYLMQKQRHNLVKHFGLKKQTTIKGTKIIRPLLGFTKSELKDFCDTNHVPYGIDSSNLTDHYLRNRIRHNIVEKLSENEKKAILQEIKQANQKNKEIYAKVAQISNKIDELCNLPDKIFSIYLNYIIETKIENYHISLSRSNSIKEALKSSNPNLKFPLKNGYYFVKEYDTLSIKKLLQKNDFTYVVVAPCILDTEYFFLDFTKTSENRNVFDDSYPLTIRNAKPSDVICIKDYKSSVRRLFIDWKMPTELRKRWPVICDKAGKIIYIPRYKKEFVVSPEINFFVKS
ncbi:MAG: tRNA lysidine(34) synthetase TilS [Bacilli bacterium]|nr:tRNA lysidine(34) synthetase TilS [Bacilli bacterium]